MSGALLLSAPLRADDAENLIKARDMVKQVEDPAGKLAVAQKIDLLTQATKLAQQVRNHRLKGSRVEAISDMRDAIAALQGNGLDQQVTTSLQAAEKELTTSISLLATAPPGAQTAPVANMPAPTTAEPPPAAPPPPVIAPIPPPAATPVESYPALSADEAAAITTMLTRALDNASRKPLGPIEDDVSAQHKRALENLNKMFADKSAKPMPLREGMAADFAGVSLNGPIISSAAKGDMALAQFNVTLTPEAAKKWNETGATTTIVGGPDDGKNDDSGVGFADFGMNERAGPEIPADGKTVAAFFVLKQAGLWKLHCIYFKNAGLTPENIDFIMTHASKMKDEPAK